ncbi:MAG: M48 family metalloprotease, partial [Rhodospirillales bacterium]|nr:M48 family metalloprotease [Rhodospirillales bacterium]
YLVNDNSLNAFVAAGQNIFVHSGLLEEADNPDQVIGVIAHETGHIIGGHLSRVREAMKKASRVTSVAFILGALAAAAGSPDAAMAVLMKGNEVAGRTYLNYSRVQESSADQAAIRLLRKTGQSPLGLREFMAKLQSLELSRRIEQVSYSRSHPLTRERVSSLDAAIKDSPYSDVHATDELNRVHQRVRAKLFGFLHSLEDTLIRYPQSDQSVPARYARAIAYHKVANLRAALSEINSILVELPDDPYILELKGQIYYEHGKIPESVKLYQLAVNQSPQEPLILASLGAAQLALEQPELAARAVENLNASLAFDPDNTIAWLQLAVAYNDVGNPGMANLATAERYVRMGMRSEAMQQAERAIHKLPEGSSGWIRANDIQNYIRSLPRPKVRRHG